MSTSPDDLDRLIASVSSGAQPQASPVSRKTSQYDPLIEKHAAANGIDPDLIRAVMGTESRGNPTATSPKGARGLLQLMPGTAAHFKVKDVNNPDENIRGGAEYLRYLSDRYSGDPDKVLAAYNAGEGNVDKYGGIPPFKETRAYVPATKDRYQKITGQPLRGIVKLGPNHPVMGQVPTKPDSLDSIIQTISADPTAAAEADVASSAANADRAAAALKAAKPPDALDAIIQSVSQPGMSPTGLQTAPDQSAAVTAQKPNEISVPQPKPQQNTQDQSAPVTAVSTPETRGLPQKGSMPGTVHLNPSIAPKVPNGAPRPFAPGEWVDNPDGSWSSEISSTIQNPDGSWSVVPGMWLVNGKPQRVDEDTAAKYVQSSGLNFPKYKTLDEAEKFATDRESVWQGVKPQDASKIQPLWSSDSTNTAPPAIPKDALLPPESNSATASVPIYQPTYNDQDVRYTGNVGRIMESGPQATEAYKQFLQRNVAHVKGKAASVDELVKSEPLATTFVNLQDYFAKNPKAKPKEQARAIAQMGKDWLADPNTDGVAMPTILHQAMLTAQWTPEEMQSLPSALQTQIQQRQAQARIARKPQPSGPRFKIAPPQTQGSMTAESGGPDEPATPIETQGQFAERMRHQPGGVGGLRMIDDPQVQFMQTVQQERNRTTMPGDPGLFERLKARGIKDEDARAVVNLSAGPPKPSIMQSADEQAQTQTARDEWERHQRAVKTMADSNALTDQLRDKAAQRTALQRVMRMLNPATALDAIAEEPKVHVFTSGAAKATGEMSSTAADLLHFVDTLGNNISGNDQVAWLTDKFRDLGSYLQSAAGIEPKTPGEAFAKESGGFAGQIEKFAITKGTSKLPLWAIIGGEAALRTQTAPLAVQAKETAFGVAQGVALEFGPTVATKILGKMPGAVGAFARQFPNLVGLGTTTAGFGGLAAEETYRKTGSKAQAAGAGLGAATAAITFGMIGGGAKEIAKEGARAEMTPEWARDRLAPLADMSRALVVDHDGRALSIYADPETQGVGGEEVSAEKADKYAQRGLEEMPVVRVSPEEFDKWKDLVKSKSAVSVKPEAQKLDTSDAAKPATAVNSSVEVDKNAAQKGVANAGKKQPIQSEGGPGDSAHQGLVPEQRPVTGADSAESLRSRPGAEAGPQGKVEPVQSKTPVAQVNQAVPRDQPAETQPAGATLPTVAPSPKPADESVLSGIMTPNRSGPHSIAGYVAADPKLKSAVLNELGEGAKPARDQQKFDTIAFQTANGDTVEVHNAYGQSKSDYPNSKFVGSPESTAKWNADKGKIIYDGIIIQRTKGEATPVSQVSREAGAQGASSLPFIEEKTLPDPYGPDRRVARYGTPDKEVVVQYTVRDGKATNLNVASSDLGQQNTIGPRALIAIRDDITRRTGVTEFEGQRVSGISPTGRTVKVKSSPLSPTQVEAKGEPKQSGEVGKEPSKVTAESPLAAQEEPETPKQIAAREAQARLDAIGPEPPKPSSEKQAFGAQGKEAARAKYPEAVARWEAETKAYNTWRRKYGPLQKAMVEASNAAFHERQNATPSKAEAVAPQTKQVEMIKAAFPDAPVEPRRIQFSDATVDGYIVTLPNGKNVAVIPRSGEIPFDVTKVASDWKVDPKKVARATGKYRGDVAEGGMIEIAPDANTGVLSHEKFHALFDLLYTPEERAAVLKRYGSEEKAAEAYRRQAGFTNSPLDKIRAFTDKIITVVKGKSFPDEAKFAPQTKEPDALDRLIGSVTHGETKVLADAMPAGASLTEASRNGSIIYFEFDAMKPVPTKKQMKAALSSEGIRAEVIRYAPGMVSGARGTVRFRADIMDEQGRMSGKAAEKAYKRAFGTDERISGRTSLEDKLTFEERFKFGVDVAKARDLGTPIEDPRGKPDDKLETKKVQSISPAANASDAPASGSETSTEPSRPGVRQGSPGAEPTEQPAERVGKPGKKEKASRPKDVNQTSPEFQEWWEKQGPRGRDAIRAYIETSSKGQAVGAWKEAASGVKLNDKAIKAAVDNLIEETDRRMSREAGAVNFGEIYGVTSNLIQRARDQLTIDPVPGLKRLGVSAQARQHASARVAVPYIVKDMLSKVFPDEYANPEAMARSIAVINADNILGGYDTFLKNAREASAGDDTGMAQFWQDRADAVGDAQDIALLEAVVEAGQNDPQIVANIERWNQVVNPELDQLYNEMKRIDPDTPREGRGRVFGARVNLLPESRAAEMKSFGDLNKPMPEAVSSNYRNPNVKKDKFMRMARFTGQYSTDAEAVLTNVVGPRWNEVTKIRFDDALVEAGAAVELDYGETPPDKIQGQKAVRLPIKMPETGEGGLTRMVEKALYVRADIAREVRDIWGTDMPAPPGPIARFLTTIQLAQLTDMTAHLKNIHTVLAAAPATKSVFTDALRRLPILGSVDSIGRIVSVTRGIIADSPESRAEQASMAKLGLIRPEYPLTGLQKITRGQQVIHHVDTASRIVMNRFFDNLVEAGRVKDTEENRASFVQQIGEYNRRLMRPGMRLMRDKGWAPFVVAGRNFNRQARRLLTGNPGVEASTLGESAKMRLVNIIAGLVAASVLPAILNLFSTGSFGGRPGTPIGAWDLGKEEDAQGRHRVIDLMQILGIRRGLRGTGTNAVVEGLREGQSWDDIIGHAGQDVSSTLFHPWMGPALGFSYQTITGKRLDLRGGPEAPDALNVGGGGKQYVENARTALENQNPLLAGILSPVTDPYESEDSYPERIGKGLIKGPTSAFGIYDLNSPAQKVLSEDRRRRGAFARTVSQVEARELKDKLHEDERAGKNIQSQLDQAVVDGKLTLRQAHDFKSNSGMSPLALQIKYAPLEASIKAFEVMDDKQKEETRTAMALKLQSAKPEFFTDEMRTRLEDDGFTIPKKIGTQRKVSESRRESQKVRKEKKAVKRWLPPETRPVIQNPNKRYRVTP